MNDILENLKNLKIGKKNLILVAIAIFIMVLLLVSEFLTPENTENISKENTEIYSSQYIEKTEKELEALLENISGAGEVKVMITLENCYENVFAKGYSEKNDNKTDSQKSESEEEYIIIKNGSNNEECLVVKVYEPTVKGVAVIAQGAGNTRVKNAITQTVCALFDISTAKVSVEKMGS
jgi:stage III sporulation protein AG